MSSSNSQSGDKNDVDVHKGLVDDALQVSSEINASKQ